MKAALIPPTPELDLFGRSDLHLLLSHLVEDPKYYHHYQRERTRGAYLILDNSAHENKEGEKARVLVNQARILNVQEVVVPDCLENSTKTVKLALDALEHWYETKRMPMAQLNPALMYVPQGRDEMDWTDCFIELCNIHAYMSRRKDFRRDFVIGISKDYEPWEGGLVGLIEKHVVPMREMLRAGGIRMHVHMLGWPRNLWTLHFLARRFPWIRSTDSAKPFVYAMAGVKLDPDNEHPPEYPRRPSGYFTYQLGPKERDLAHHNTLVFQSAARGDLYELQSV